MKGYWNGLETEVTQGTAVVASETGFSQYWGAHLAGQRIAVIRVVLDGVNFGGGVTYLDDREGQGTFKVTEGFGSPRWGHRDVVIEEGSFVANSVKGMLDGDNDSVLRVTESGQEQDVEGGAGQTEGG